MEVTNERRKPLVLAPILVPAGVQDCSRHLISQKMVLDPFDAKEAVRVMRSFRMNVNAIDWIEANPDLYAWGVLVGFRVEDGGQA